MILRSIAVWEFAVRIYSAANRRNIAAWEFAARIYSAANRRNIAAWEFAARIYSAANRRNIAAWEFAARIYSAANRRNIAVGVCNLGTRTMLRKLWFWICGQNTDEGKQFEQAHCWRIWSRVIFEFNISFCGHTSIDVLQTMTRNISTPSLITLLFIEWKF